MNMKKKKMKNLKNATFGFYVKKKIGLKKSYQ